MSDDMRTFQWFQPQKRRATVYEDVTVDTQPSPKRHMERGWLVSFEDGRGTWDDHSTALQMDDWYAFRDPGQYWERPFYQVGAGVEREIESAVRAAAADRLFDDFDPGWVEFLRQNLQVPAFVEHGLWLATASIARECLSDTVCHCVVLQASLKQRMAQSIVLYAMDLERHFGEFPIEAAQRTFLEAEAWQPTRAYLERLRATADWGEVIVATNLCFEPLVGVAIRRELGIRAATANGDSVTSVPASVGQREWGWVRDWTTAFMRFVCEDEAHGAENRKRIGGWIADWLPQARAAAAALEGALAQSPVELDFHAGLERVARDAAVFWEEAGVHAPTGAAA